MTTIDLRAVTRSFGGSAAVDDVSLHVPESAFFALLGPSGCGKTTLLRLIAGLERPDAGEIRLGGRVMAGPGGFVPPESRGLGMVFQSYALWPHMTVAGNIGFGLRLQRLGRVEEQRRIGEALEMVGLQGFGARRPHELSGGQRQRVALARSLAMRPGLILLDEPLANLDAHLRETMLAEFRRIHAASRTTFVFVTHDQDEAMAVATQVAVMDRGRIAQTGSPEVLCFRPATPMVARFVGKGRTVPVEVTGRASGRCDVMLAGRRFSVPGAAEQGPGWLCLRSRDVTAVERSGDLRMIVHDTAFRGGDWRATGEIVGAEDGGTIDVLLPRPVAPGATVDLRLDGGWVLPRESMDVAAALEGVGA
ncbi:ABC transporter ATP-binding protein [Haematobacter massiliensis]|uniref:ABC transporter n=1 Tax=Haematobacter massiliensis TaxID=195105 RepID=A0A086Y6J9_9RHOB|nr:ABC transporter ATP-binding protein [Haematobacter massiliensis]KFI29899.1 ABC transporter [Haematobacter massiliensis]OWJ72962.1 ABC transporter ATP-binding protein [Haematobacter massiliensis]OWJ88441.1 ABC transporter ATP-binding protein [Haematobacter massiliensis]QBJ25725.1 ABC transporter ATP-binding protein [Haematobacter massiliensis]